VEAPKPMKITVYLTKDLIHDAETAAAERHTTLSSFIGDAIRMALERRRRARSGRKFKVITYGKGGVHPGVNLDDTSALLDIMDGIKKD
jgi:hypothetical protein